MEAYKDWEKKRSERKVKSKSIIPFYLKKIIITIILYGNSLGD